MMSLLAGFRTATLSAYRSSRSYGTYIAPFRHRGLPLQPAHPANPSRVRAAEPAVADRIHRGAAQQRHTEDPLHRRQHTRETGVEPDQALGIHVDPIVGHDLIVRCHLRTFGDAAP